MILPIYILRRTIKPGGERMPKLVPLPKASRQSAISKWRAVNMPTDRPCAVCHEPVGVYKIGNQEQLSGEWRGGEFFHTDCFKLTGGEAKRKNGNLPNEEYRFWIGYAHENGVGAVCRACAHYAYGPQERKNHLNDDTKAIEGMRCAEQLSRVYAALLKDRVACIVCCKDRHNYEKWGVPLCNSGGCEVTWRFDREKRYVMLETRLDRLRGGKIPGVQKPGLTQIERIVSKFTPGEFQPKYCSDCAMWMDDAAHAQIHAARELGEGFNHNVEKD